MESNVTKPRSRPLRTAVVTVAVIFGGLAVLIAIASSGVGLTGHDTSQTLTSKSDAGSGKPAVSDGAEHAQFPSPAEFVSRWNSVASSRLDQLQEMGDSFSPPDNSYFIGYIPADRTYIYSADPNTSASDIADRCAMMLHAANPRLRLSDAETLVIRAGQSAALARIVPIDGVTFTLTAQGHVICAVAPVVLNKSEAEPMPKQRETVVRCRNAEGGLLYTNTPSACAPGSAPKELFKVADPISTNEPNNAIAASPPRITIKTAPTYPPAAVRNRHEGIVLVKVLVGSDGAPKDISVLHSSGFRELDKAAQDAVRNWRFSPATRAGTAVDDYTNVPVHFALNQVSG